MALPGQRAFPELLYRPGLLKALCYVIHHSASLLVRCGLIHLENWANMEKYLECPVAVINTEAGIFPSYLLFLCFYQT